MGFAYAPKIEYNSVSLPDLIDIIVLLSTYMTVKLDF